MYVGSFKVVQSTTVVLCVGCPLLKVEEIHWSRDLNISKLNDVVRRGGGKEGEGQRFLRGDNFTKITNKNVNKHDS